jgi:rod shape-determining protein MreD
MGVLIIFGLFVLSLVLQGSVLALAGTGGIHPDLLLVAVVALALLSDGKRGAFLGFSAGLLQDVLTAAPLGFFTFGKMLAGLLAGMLAREVYRDFLPVPVMMITGLTLLNETVTYFLVELYFTPALTFPDYLRIYTLPRLLMHALVMVLVYPYMLNAQRRRVFFAEMENDADRWFR